jgi:two-component system sensor histidine kinase VicK
LPEPWASFSLRSFVRGLFAPGAEISQERVSPDDERVYTVIGIPARSGSETAIVVVADVSERESLEAAERQFVANASHELRTPLTTIVGAVEALQSGAKEEPPERDRFLNLIERESGRLARLARALLVLARAQTRTEMPRLSPVEIRPLLEELAAVVESKPDVAVQVTCEPGLSALADGDLTEQALRNLVENAVKYTDHGAIVLSAERSNGAVVIQVRDSGPGMSPESQRRIFERFYRSGGRDADGFGLGLAIARQAVQVLGGELELSSTLGQGTTVSISLPAAETATL